MTSVKYTQPFSWITAGLFRKMYCCLLCSSCLVVWSLIYNQRCKDTRKSISTACPCGAKKMWWIFWFIFGFVCMKVYEQREVWLSTHPCSLVCLVRETEFKDVSWQLNILFRVDETSIQNIILIAKTVFPWRQTHDCNYTLYKHKHQGISSLLSQI